MCIKGKDTVKCLFFVRHGESQWNVEDKICGVTDSPLTEKGHDNLLLPNYSWGDGFTVYYPEDNPTYTLEAIHSCGGAQISTWVSVPAPDCMLPSDLQRLEDEALTGCAFRCVCVPDGVTKIGKHAFYGSPDLKFVYVPVSATDLDPEAFDGVTGLTVIGSAGSAAEEIASAAGCTFLPCDNLISG